MGSEPGKLEEIDVVRLFAYRMSGSFVFACAVADQASSLTIRVEGRRKSDYRSALFEFANNLCLSELTAASRRGLPCWSGPAGGRISFEGDRNYPGANLEPFPDGMLPDRVCASSRFTDRESVSLELVGALQRLEPRSRAVLILRELNGFDGILTGSITGSAEAEVDSTLSESLALLDDSYPRERGLREPPSHEDAARLLMRYIRGWESVDPLSLESIFSEDVVVQAPPSPGWLQGRFPAAELLASGPLRADNEGSWRLLPLRANGQLAFAAYRRDGRGGNYRAHSLHVVYFSGHAISELIAFLLPASLFTLTGLLPELIAQGETPR